jgi:hypothetical protein
MTIQLIKATYISGSLQSAASQHTLDAAVEADLVNIGAASYVGGAPDVTNRSAAFVQTDAYGSTSLVGAGGMSYPLPHNHVPRIQSVHDLQLAEPLYELSLTSPYGVGTATAGGKYEFAYGTPVYCAQGFNGYKFWMVAAPYPTEGVDLGGLLANKYENPCILASNDGENWVVPDGMTNPIATSIGLSDTTSYYADPYIAFNADFSKLYVTFMWTNQSGATKTSLMVTESSDGVTWSTPVSIYNATDNAVRIPNSPSIFWNGNGWTCLTVNTKSSGGYVPEYMTTSSAEPYTGWSAFATSTWTHPLSRAWWHGHFIPLDGGTIIGMAVDNSSSGGTIYSLQSSDGGATFSVKPFSAWRTSAAGGSWYRPSLCVVSDGVDQSLIGYFSRIGPLQQAGFFIQKARLVTGKTDAAIANAVVEDFIHRQVTVPASLLTNTLAGWDSFNRADDATGLGTSDSGLAWTNATGQMGIGTNRAYNATAAGGNSIATIDPGLQNFEFSVVIETMGTTGMVVWNLLNSTNFWRFGYNSSAAKFQKIVGGSATLDKTLLLTISSGDRLMVRRQGKYITIFHNGRPIDTYYDATHSQYTKLGVQAADATITYFGQMYVKPI